MHSNHSSSCCVMHPCIIYMYDCSCDICIVCLFVHVCLWLLIILFFSHPNLGGCLLIFVVPWQQMQRRSNRIQDHHERVTERSIHEEEELVAPRWGRQNRGNHKHRQGHEQPQEDDIPNTKEVPEEGEEEVEQNIGNDLVQGEEPLPPLPTLAEVMDRQTRLLKNLARRQDNGNRQGKMATFMRLHPPTFDSVEDDPLSADDWLHTVGIY